MNLKPWKTRGISLLLSGALAFGSLPAALATEGAPLPALQTEGNSLSALAAEVQQPASARLVSATNYTLVSGVTESDVLLNNDDGTAQIAGFMTTVEPGAQVTFKASYAGYYTAGSTAESRKEAAADLAWELGKTTVQAADYEAATGERVIFATNGDYYNMQTAQPLGYLIMEGNQIQTTEYNQEPYFAVLEDGSYALRDAGTDASDVAEAISGPFWLLRNGQIQVDANNADLMPRNSIGIKADGSIVIYVADGRQDPYSVGQTLYSMADFLKAQGVVDAIYLDGGGSATYVSEREGSEGLEIRNSPSDGTERAVSSALLLVYTGESTGAFDHAVLTPNNEQYTPGSTVQFRAAGVDSAGRQADLPDDLSWSLEDARAGAIDQSGSFTAAEGFTGTVTVNLSSKGQVVGSTSIVIDDIDQLYFTGESISLDFGEESDLGLNAKASLRAIHYKEGDFQWSVDNEAVGCVTGNTFTAGQSDSTLTGNVTVSYTTLEDEILTDTISVEVGKMPVVLLDFEPDEDGHLEQCAHFHWGQKSFVDSGMTEGYRGTVDSVEVITSGKYSGSPTTATVTAPYVFTGNWDSAVPASDIFRANGYTYYLWPNSAIPEYESGDLKVVTGDNGQVRFGEAALELDYDYASYDGSSNANYYIRYCGEDIDIEGYPSEVGVWVYAPEATPSAYTLYIQVEYWDKDKKDYVAKYIPLKAEGSEATGFTWSGWAYCSADITSLWSNISEGHPLKIQPGQGILWLSYQPKTGGGRYNGSLYFDNFRVVYGTDMDDLINPEITSTTINGVELAEDGSTVVDANYIEIITQYHDPESDNRSGINAEATIITIDGERKNADKSTTETRSNASLNNGQHTLGVTVFDGFGNSVAKTYSFTVKNDAQSTPEVSVTGQDTVTMGQDYVLSISASDRTVRHVTLELTDLNSDFGEPAVTFADGYTGTHTYTSTGFKKAALHVEVNLTGSAQSNLRQAAAQLCTITFQVPTDLDAEIDFFTYNPSTIRYTDVSGSSYSGAQPGEKLTLSAYYTVEAGVLTQGDPCTILVTDPDGRPAAGVEVWLGEAQIGTTGAEGTLTSEATRAMEAGAKCVFTAKSGSNVSFATEYTVMAHAGNGEGKPGSIRFAAGTDSRTKQTVTWMSNASAAGETAVVRYMTKADYDARSAGAAFDFAQTSDAYTQVTGQSTLTAFSVSKSAARVNRAELTGLEPGTTYCGVVGDGIIWSDVRTFTTSPAQQNRTSFLVVGDTQMSGNPESDADAIDILNQIGTSVQGQSFDFGLQTGDFVDNGANYNQWSEILDLFDQNFGGTDFITVLGNHEYYGDTSGGNARNILALPAEGYYSVEYGDVYLAVINNGANLSEAADWLVSDAARSDCQWKLLSVHQPAYYTNPNGGSDRCNAIIPPAAEQAGIDAVFSGHDHSYARTAPMTGGSVDSSGVTYFICGDLGEKSRSDSYKIVDNPDFHFVKASQEYDGIYLTGTAEGSTLTITAYNCDGTQVDTVTLSHADNTSGGSGSSGSTNHSVSVSASEHGSVTASPRSAKKGDTITLTATPDAGYRLDALTVTDTKGARLAVTEQNGKYTFTMPDSKVEIKASFVRSQVQPQELPFTDVAAGAWYEEAVRYVYEKGLMSGTSSTSFRPEDATTRGMIVTILYRLEGTPAASPARFDDVAAGRYYTDAVAWAAANGIVSGYGNGSFGPEDVITREQIAAILYRYAAYKGYDVSGRADLSGYTDRAQVSGYAAEAMAWANAAGLMTGTSASTLTPGGPATRAQAAALLMRLCEQLTK